MILTFCLYTVKLLANKMLTKCFGGVILPINKIQTGLRLEPDILKKATWIAKKQKRSLNAQLEFAVQQCIEEYEAANGAIPIEEED
jgi:hypothetical protein